MISEFFKAIGEAFASNREESRKADDFFEQSLKKASHDRPPPQPNPKKPANSWLHLRGGETYTDPRDGQTYRTVKIGDQVWMAENLNYEAKGSRCYGNDPANAKKYGRLYNRKTAMKVCPPGWHLPSDKEWDVLIEFVGGKEVAGKNLKSKSGWNNYEGINGNGKDTYGFSALPGGKSGNLSPSLGADLDWLDETFNVHLDLVTIHPWADGNGRVARLIMNFLQFYFKIVPTKVFLEDRAEYIASLRESQDTNDNSYFLKFIALEHLKTLEKDIS